MNSAEYYTRQSIREIFNAVDSASGAMTALHDHKRLLSKPLIDRQHETYSRHGAVVLEIAACNMESGLMDIPVYVGTKRPQWHTARIETAYVTNFPVYSLDVEKYHTYIADGIITHNCIYSWAGADVNLLIDAPGELRVLGNSYRLPRSVFDVAIQLVSKIGHRVPKEWEPRDDHGEVKHIADVADLPLEQGTWYLLARNRYLLTNFTDELRRRGLLYTTQSGPSIEQDTLDAIRAWESLRKGREVSARLCSTIYELMAVVTGYDRGAKARLDAADGLLSLTDLQQSYGLLAAGPWYEALSRIAPDDVHYLRACLRHGEKLSAANRIHVSTMHGVKGGEAENVAVLPDMSWQSWEGFMKEPDHELRVFYVAVTRAREKLWLLPAQGNRAMGF